MEDPFVHLCVVVGCQIVFVLGTWVMGTQFVKTRYYLVFLEMVQKVVPLFYDEIVLMRIFLMSRPIVNTTEEYEHFWYSDILEKQYLDSPQHVRPYVEHLISHGNPEKAFEILEDPIKQPQWMLQNHDRIWYNRMHQKIDQSLDTDIPEPIPLKL